MNYALYLQQILDNPNTPREEYMHAWEERRDMDMEQRYLDQIAAERFAKANDKLTGGQNV